MIYDLITYLGPQPTLVWRWVAILENINGLTCTITDVGNEEPADDTD
jgi:hypothetical protein